MVSLGALWLPLVLSAVFVFIVSSVIHMALKYHKSDYRKLPDEDKVMDSLRSAGVSPGPVYFFPWHEMKDMKAPEVQEKFKRGPLGQLTIRPSGVPAMGKFLGQWFVYCLVVSLFTAYIAGRTMSAGTEFMQVFRVTWTVAFMAYGLAQAQQSIWAGQTWGVTIKHTIDSLIYGLVTGATFAWRWPA